MIDEYPIELESFDDYVNGSNGKKLSTNSKYHYTTYAGLRGIIEEKAFWFTDSQFLNDPEEQLYYLHRVKGLLETKIKLANSEYSVNIASLDTLRDLLKVTDEILQRPHYGALGTEEMEDVLGKQKFRYYYFCLSNYGDDVALWSMYCEKHGYNLALSPYSLAQEITSIHAAKGTKLYFGSVEYDAARQDELLEQCIDRIIKEHRDHVGMFNEDDQRLLVLRVLFFRHFELCRLFIKNPFHSSEKEFRLVLKACPDDKRIKNGFRDRNGIITPYKELKTTLNPLREIHVAPALEFDLAKRGIGAFLSELEVDSVKILSSDGKVR